jgi:hypothetical protein
MGSDEAGEGWMMESCTRFSFVIPATPQQGAWFKAVHEAAMNLIFFPAEDPGAELPPGQPDVQAAAVAIAGNCDDDPGIEVRYDERLAEIWVVSETQADLEYTAALVQALLVRFRLDRVVGFQWAGSAGRMKANGFGGGAVVITRRDQTWFTTSTAMEKMSAAVARRLAAPERETPHMPKFRVRIERIEIHCLEVEAATRREAKEKAGLLPLPNTPAASFTEVVQVERLMEGPPA